MIMLLIMGNFKKENLSRSELNCFCFYIKVGYFFTPFKILYLSVERRDGWIIQELILPTCPGNWCGSSNWWRYSSFSTSIENILESFIYIKTTCLHVRKKKPCRTCQQDRIQHVRLKSLLIFCSWICFSFYLAKHSCVSIAMNSRNLKKGEMRKASTT